MKIVIIDGQGGNLSDYIRQVCEEVGRHLNI